MSFAWTWLIAVHQASEVLAPGLEGQKLIFDARVASLPTYTADGGTRFDAHPIDSGTDSDADLTKATALPDKIRLTFSPRWLKDKTNLIPIESGDVLRINAKLKRPWSYANPGGFDYEKYLFHQGIGATGYVINYKHIKHASDWRQWLFNRLLEVSKTHAQAGAIVSLSLGTPSLIPKETEYLLRATGTRHLFAISGLHIGMVFMGAFFFAAWLWRGMASRFRNFSFTQRDFAGAFALPVATAYAFLAGFSLPTQRALLMLACVCFIGWVRRYLSPGHALAFALIAVLIVKPLSSLSASFWFSFLTTAVIVWATYGITLNKPGRSWITLQLVLLPVTLALSMSVFHYGALNAPLSNFFAIPLVSFAILPLCLLTILVLPLNETLAGVLVSVTDFLFGTLWVVLDWSSAVSGGATMHSPARWTIPLVLVGLLVIVVARRVGTKLSGVLLFLPFWFYTNDSRPAYGEFDLTFLDVGQGLAAVVRTHNEVLLYDTADAYTSGSVAERVIIPYLRHQNISKINHLVVSHADRDHSGGARDITDTYDIARRTTSASAIKVPALKNFALCTGGERWIVDGVEFKFLHPPEDWRHVNNSSRRRGKNNHNNSSCVLQIGTANYCAILTGDIEKSGEQSLLEHNKGARCPVVQVPHHGSKTSSSQQFIENIFSAAPRIAVVSAGRKNRHGHPKPAVIQRYLAHNAEVLNTATTGALSIRFARASKQDFKNDFKNKGPACVAGAYRADKRAYWHLSNAKQPIYTRCR